MNVSHSTNHTPISRVRAVSRHESRSNLKTPSGHSTNTSSSRFVSSSRTFDESTTLVGSSSKGNLTGLTYQHSGNYSSAHQCPSSSNQLSLVLPIEEVSVSNLNHFAKNKQETLLLEDLINLLLGINGTYLKMEKSRRGIFNLNTDFAMDETLREIVKLIMPCIVHFWTIRQFVEERSRFEFGVTNHALAATLRDIIKEYMIVIAQLEQRQLESETFTLQQFWFLLKPNSESIRLLFQLIEKIVHPNLALISPRKPTGTIDTIRGGQVIQIIHFEQIKNLGYPKAKALYQHILDRTSLPYLKMIRQWIHRGEISDPFDEFMINERHGLSKEQIKDDFSDVYWDQRYTLRTEYIPPFLIALKDKVLLAGKYLNVIGECGIDTNIDFKIEYSLNDDIESLKEHRLQKEIEAAYKSANQKLLQLIFDKYSLVDRLKSMKRYFLMDQSDFVVAFLDCAEEELEKPVKMISLEHVRSLMELVLRNPSSVSVHDPYKEDITIEMNKLSLFDQLMKITSKSGFSIGKLKVQADEKTPFSSSEDLLLSKLSNTLGNSNMMTDPELLKGIESITMGYVLKFPLSLILNKKIMTKYQILFRYLILCKYVESKLGSSWKLLSSSRLNGHRGQNKMTNSAFFNQLCLMTSKMLGFIQQLLYYGTFEVIEPHWQKMIESLTKTDTVDQVLELHDDFLDTCLKECMMTNSKLIKLFKEMTDICLSFSKFAFASVQLMHTELYSEASEAAIKIAEADVMNNMMNSLDKYLMKSEENEIRMNSLTDYQAFGTNSNRNTKKTPDSILMGIQDKFRRTMNLMLESLQFHGATETAVFSDLASRLDYGHFYARENMLKGTKYEEEEFMMNDGSVRSSSIATTTITSSTANVNTIIGGSMGDDNNLMMKKKKEVGKPIMNGSDKASHLKSSSRMNISSSTSQEDLVLDSTNHDTNYTDDILLLETMELNDLTVDLHDI